VQIRRPRIAVVLQIKFSDEFIIIAPKKSLNAVRAPQQILF